jgi:transcriptional regulator with XRE-family HTH domain
MDIQIITRDGEPEYAVLPWAQYQALLKAAGINDTARRRSAACDNPDPILPGLDQLRSLREGKGIAIEALARTVGISPSYLAMIESGERLPDAAIRRSLAWELTVPGGGMNRERTHQSSTLGRIAGRAGSGAPSAPSIDLSSLAGTFAAADAGHANPDCRA